MVSKATTGLDGVHEPVSRDIYVLQRFTILHDTIHSDLTTRTRACPSFLPCEFIEGPPDLFDEVIEVSCPVEFVNQDGESW